MYKKKCLFKNSNATWGKEATAQESVHAYLYGTGTTKTTGRYRIRITKMSAADLVALGMVPEGTPPDFFGMQANLDKWHVDNGWVPLFDWVGDPEASIRQIEKDLNKQFEAFVTGIGIEEDFSFDLPEPPRVKGIKIPKTKPPSGKDNDATGLPKGEEPPKGDDPDFEWL